MSVKNATSILSTDTIVLDIKRFISYDDVGDKWHVIAISEPDAETKRLDVLVPDKIKELAGIIHIAYTPLPDYGVIRKIPIINEFIKSYKNPGIDGWYNRIGKLVVLMHDKEWKTVKTILMDVKTGNEVEIEIINKSQAISIAKNETKVKEFLDKHKRFNESAVYDRINAQWKITFYDSEIIIHVLIDAESGSIIDLNELNYKDVKDNFR